MKRTVLKLHIITHVYDYAHEYECEFVYEYINKHNILTYWFTISIKFIHFLHHYKLWKKTNEKWFKKWYLVYQLKDDVNMSD